MKTLSVMEHHINEGKLQMIYTNQLYDNQKPGEKPTGFELFVFENVYILPVKHFQTTYDNVEIVKVFCHMVKRCLKCFLLRY